MRKLLILSVAGVLFVCTSVCQAQQAMTTREYYRKARPIHLPAPGDVTTEPALVQHIDSPVITTVPMSHPPGMRIDPNPYAAATLPTNRYLGGAPQPYAQPSGTYPQDSTTIPYESQPIIVNQTAPFPNYENAVPDVVISDSQAAPQTTAGPESSRPVTSAAPAIRYRRPSGVMIDPRPYADEQITRPAYGQYQRHSSPGQQPYSLSTYGQSRYLASPYDRTPRYAAPTMQPMPQQPAAIQIAPGGSASVEQLPSTDTNTKPNNTVTPSTSLRIPTGASTLSQGLPTTPPNTDSSEPPLQPNTDSGEPLLQPTPIPMPPTPAPDNTNPQPVVPDSQPSDVFPPTTVVEGAIGHDAQCGCDTCCSCCPTIQYDDCHHRRGGSFWDWLTYRPLPSSACCGKFCASSCRPHLYLYFLRDCHPGTVRNHCGYGSCHQPACHPHHEHAAPVDVVPAAAH